MRLDYAAILFALATSAAAAPTPARDNEVQHEERSYLVPPEILGTYRKNADGSITIDDEHKVSGPEPVRYVQRSVWDRIALSPVYNKWDDWHRFHIEALASTGQGPGSEPVQHPEGAENESNQEKRFVQPTPEQLELIANRRRPSNPVPVPHEAPAPANLPPPPVVGTPHGTYAQNPRGRALAEDDGGDERSQEKRFVQPTPEQLALIADRWRPSNPVPVPHEAPAPANLPPPPVVGTPHGTYAQNPRGRALVGDDESSQEKRYYQLSPEQLGLGGGRRRPDNRPLHERPFNPPPPPVVDTPHGTYAQKRRDLVDDKAGNESSQDKRGAVVTPELLGLPEELGGGHWTPPSPSTWHGQPVILRDLGGVASQDDGRGDTRAEQQKRLLRFGDQVLRPWQLAVPGPVVRGGFGQDLAQDGAHGEGQAEAGSEQQERGFFGDLFNPPVETYTVSYTKDASGAVDTAHPLDPETGERIAFQAPMALMGKRENEASPAQPTQAPQHDERSQIKTWDNVREVVTMNDWLGGLAWHNNDDSLPPPPSMHVVPLAKRTDAAQPTQAPQHDERSQITTWDNVRGVYTKDWLGRIDYDHPVEPAPSIHVEPLKRDAPQHEDQPKPTPTAHLAPNDKRDLSELPEEVRNRIWNEIMGARIKADERRAAQSTQTAPAVNQRDIAKRSGANLPEGIDTNSLYDQIVYDWTRIYDQPAAQPTQTAQAQALSQRDIQRQEEKREVLKGDDKSFWQILKDVFRFGKRDLQQLTPEEDAQFWDAVDKINDVAVQAGVYPEQTQHKEKRKEVCRKEDRNPPGDCRRLLKEQYGDAYDEPPLRPAPGWDALDALVANWPPAKRGRLGPLDFPEPMLDCNLFKGIPNPPGACKDFLRDAPDRAKRDDAQHKRTSSRAAAPTATATGAAGTDTDMETLDAVCTLVLAVAGESKGDEDLDELVTLCEELKDGESGKGGSRPAPTSSSSSRGSSSITSSTSSITSSTSSIVSSTSTSSGGAEATDGPEQ